MPPSTATDEVDDQESASVLDAAPPVRQRVADHVFETLAKAILAERFTPGEPLPTQRALAKQFNISALVVRQAIHRLEELGLVRVRQGSSTIVLDPEESTDIRLIQLRLELAQPEPALFRAVLESQVLFVVPLLVLAERRITPEQVAVLDYIVNGLGENASAEDARKFRIAYWTQVADAGGNAMYRQQIRWWGRMTSELRRRARDFDTFGARVVIDVYRRLNQAFAKHEGAVGVYLKSIEPLLDWTERSAADAHRDQLAKTAR